MVESDVISTQLGAPPGVDPAALRLGRLARLREEMAKREIAALVLLDPVNIRYATGARNMQVFMARNPARYLFLPLEGPVVLFEFEGCLHLAEGLETIGETRPVVTVSAVAADLRLEERARIWAEEIAQLARAHGGKGCRLGIERVSIVAMQALSGHGFDLVDAQIPIERARARKTAEEIVCIRASIAAVEAGVARLRAALEPGLSEDALWSELHRAVIEADGDYIETRLLASGPRSNPWFQETSLRRIEAGDLVALDTDVVGPYGYYTDFSRTFLCGDKPSEEQRKLYGLAREQIETNLARLAPGMSFREFAEKAWPIPEAYQANRYFVLAHGVGMTGEYPYILHAQDFADHGYDGHIEPGMTLCLESYIGARGGREGVKLEQQVLITESGGETLSHFPFEASLEGRQI